jgi:hypothetical protein
MNTIYLYTTKSQSKRSVATIDGEVFNVRLKVGQTMLTADERVAQQDSTSNSEKLEIIYSRQVPSHITDIALHKTLQRKGYFKSRDDKNREWFDFPNCNTAKDASKQVREVLNGLINGVEALEDWKSFDYQQDIIDWAVQRSSVSSDVLINAIMRAGKCRISYEIARALGAKKILIVTAKVGVNDSWASLLPGGEENHIDYTGWKYHNYKKIKSLEYSNTTDVVFVSLQFINKHMGTDNKFLKEVLATNWDSVFFDEQHYATSTDNTRRLWESLTFKFKAELSGTPYKTMLSGRYTSEDTYNFDYVDEQTIRKQLLDVNADDFLTSQFRKRADINYALVNVPTKVKALLGEEGFTFSKLFATENGNFKNVMGVNEFVTFIMKNFKKPPAKFSSVADKLSRHTLFVLPDNVEAIGLFAKVLEAHPFFCKRKIINASGKGVKNIQKVKDIISRNDHDGGAGTITLTCGRFLEGTTVPEWWSIHQINNDKSASDYFQGSFRCKSPADGKESVLVYDYAPERFVSVVYDYCERVADADNTTPEKVISTWLEVSDVYDYDGNAWNILTGAEISTRFLADIRNHIDRIGSCINQHEIDDTIIALLQNKSKDSNSNKSRTQFNANDIEEGKNKARNKKNYNQPTDTDEDELNVTMQRIRYSLKQIYKLADIAWANDLEFEKIQDVPQLDSDIVAQVTGLTNSEWSSIMNTINTVSANRALGQYYEYQ